MSYRFMRVIVLFDLPTLTSNDRKAYRTFRKFLITNGFLMLQESVYSKLALNGTVANRVIRNVEKNVPDKGLVQMLTVTEKQFSKMTYLVGDKKSEVIDNDQRLLIL